jgi:cell division septation protein DedD
MFIVGYIVGRATFEPNSLGFFETATSVMTSMRDSVESGAKKLSASVFGEDFAEPEGDLNEEADPLFGDRAVVAAASEQISPAELNGYWTAYLVTGDPNRIPISEALPEEILPGNNLPPTGDQPLSGLPMADLPMENLPLANLPGAAKPNEPPSGEAVARATDDDSTRTAAAANESADLTEISSFLSEVQKTDPVQTASTTPNSAVQTASATPSSPVQTASATPSSAAQTSPPNSPNVQAAPAAQNSSDQPAAQASDDDEFWPAKPAKTGAYTIQVGSTRSFEEAKEFANDYLEKGFPETYCYRTKTGRYNIRVGRYDTEEEAKKAVDLLVAAGANKPYVSKLNIN